MPAPPPLPEADRSGCLLRTRVGRQRRRLVRRAFAVPLVALVGLLAVFVALGVFETAAEALVPEWLEDIYEGLPGFLGRLTPLQLTLIPFLAIVAWQTGRGWRYARATWDAELSVTVDGRLEQRDEQVERVELGHLVHVDVVPNRAFTDLNEAAPIGSIMLLRLTDASGAVVDINPRMWVHHEAVTDIVRHYVFDGHAAVTDDAAERYDLPRRGRHGELHEHAISSDDWATDDGAPPADPELEAPLKELGIDVRRVPRRGRGKRGDRS